MKPPKVYELTIPSPQRSSKTTAIVHNMGFPFLKVYCSATQIASLHGSCQCASVAAEPPYRFRKAGQMVLSATQP
jgi:hypothetical protein